MSAPGVIMLGFIAVALYGLWLLVASTIHDGQRLLVIEAADDLARALAADDLMG